MINVSREEFEKLVNNAVKALPKIYQEHLNNVAFIVEEVPSQEHLTRGGVGPNQVLFGLYEGVPLSQRQGTQKILPDIITIFQKPIEYFSKDLQELNNRVGRTVWHEVAHYYGLDHRRIKELEDKESK